MSQRDLNAQLRAGRITAPAEVRERVRAIAATDTTARAPRFTWRRALILALPVAAAVAAGIVFTRPSHETSAVPATPAVVAQNERDAAKKAPGRVFSTHAGNGSALRNAGVPTRSLGIPPSRTRLQRYGASLTLRVPTPDGVSTGVKRALRIAGSLGGHPTSVHASSRSRSAHADLVLKIPRANVQRAITRLSQLGTITGERVDVQDVQAGLDATGRTIGRLQSQLISLRAQTPSSETTRRIASLTARVAQLQRARANTIRTTRFATVRVQLATPAVHGAAASTHRGPFHWLVRALVWLGVGTVYVLVLGFPVALAGLVVALLVRAVRRRREEALLSAT